MQVQGHVPGAYSLFWFGASRTAWPPLALPLDLAQFGAPGCVLWAPLEVEFGSLLDGSGQATIALPVPNLPEFALVTVYSQACVFAPGANPFGLVFSRGMAIRIE